MDPTLLALLSIFGGSGLTVGAGLIGAAVQARRENRRWLREQRYAAFVNVLALHRQTLTARMTWDALPDNPAPETRQRATAAYEAILGRFPEAISPLELLGPDSVTKAAERALTSVEMNQPEQVEALNALTDSMRAALRISGTEL